MSHSFRVTDDMVLAAACVIFEHAQSKPGLDSATLFDCAIIAREALGAACGETETTSTPTNTEE